MTSSTIDLAVAADEALSPLADWNAQCHGASIKLVKSGALYGPCRVARGWCEGVGSQHSWVVVGDDCYDKTATIVDPTLWSYRNDVEGVWVGTLADGLHHPHGEGQIWAWGKPPSGFGVPVTLTPSEPWSKEAELFLELLGPLDRQGWAMLANQAPVEDWPAGEIYAAMCDSGMEAVVPIDRLGMLTDRNPSGLYLPETASVREGAER